MERVAIVGAPGSGKTTAARDLAARLGVAHIELDSIFHQAGWTPLPRDEFRAQVRQVVAGDGWVIDGNYVGVQDLVWEAADTVVWLDLPRRTVVRRVAVRTLRRAITREQLWNGNREPVSNLYRFDPEQNIVRWTWITYPEHAERYVVAMTDAAHRRLRFVRLTSQAEIDRFVG